MTETEELDQMLDAFLQQGLLTEEESPEGTLYVETDRMRELHEAGITTADIMDRQRRADAQEVCNIFAAAGVLDRSEVNGEPFYSRTERWAEYEAASQAGRGDQWLIDHGAVIEERHRRLGLTPPA